MLVAGILTSCTKCKLTTQVGKRVFCLNARRRGADFLVPRRQLFTSRIKLAADKTVAKDASKVASKSTIPKYTDVKRLLALARAEKWKIGGAVCFLAVSSTVSLAVPFCMGKVIDIINTASQHGDLVNKLNSICSVLLVVFLIGGIANFGRVYLMEISGERIVRQMRKGLFSSVMRQDIAFFDKTKTGELINRLSADTSLIGNSVTFNISDGLRSLAQAGGACGMMMYVSPKLTLVALCIVPPVAIMSRIYGRYVKKITKEVQDSLAESSAVAEERITHIRTVRSFAKEDHEMERYSEAIQRVLVLQYKQALARGVFWGSTGLSGNVIVLSVFYAGGMMMNDSLLTIGELSAFLLYAAYIGVSIGGMTSFYTELMRGLGASSRIWELMDRQPLVPSSGGLIPSKPLEGTIQFSDVKFNYPTRPDADILSELTLTMPAGTVTAVVGASGSGKSTVGSLLLRLYDPNSGNILIDGENIKNYDPSWLRNQIGVVSQEPALFSCSVADNIRYGAPDPSAVSMEMVEAAAKQANAHMFVRSFPQEFDTVVGESGRMLSGGQKQRIALARAILKNPRILLLDEATSALDAESEYLVQEALERLMVGRTVITIAHRLSTIKSAHQIAVLHEGRVAEVGPYAQLMAIEQGIFRRLVERQTITT